MIRIAVAEDDRAFRDTCTGYIKRYCAEKKVDAQVFEFEDGMDLLEGQEEKGKSFDILFLDVQMKHLDGFYTAGRIREKDDQAVIVFITTLAQYAVRGYEVDAMDYLIKPLSYERFCPRLEKALQRVSRFQEQYIFLPSGDGKDRVAATSILYIDVDRHTLRVHTKGRTYEMRMPIGKMEEELSPSHFLRCDQSVLVNPRFVVRVGKDTVEVGDDENTILLPVSRSRKKQFLQDLAALIG
ncbi:MAG: LytR/AlgR family response regulator transcription factor [bacterium]